MHLKLLHLPSTGKINIAYGNRNIDINEIKSYFLQTFNYRYQVSLFNIFFVCVSWTFPNVKCKDNKSLELKIYKPILNVQWVSHVVCYATIEGANCDHLNFCLERDSNRGPSVATISWKIACRLRPFSHHGWLTMLFTLK